MQPKELYEAGRLQEAIAAQIALVKDAPADEGKRMFLFELLAFACQWERARRQLDALQFSEVERQTAAVQYRDLLAAEEQRQKVFAGAGRPEFLTEAPKHALLRLEAVAALAAGRAELAAERVAEANELTPPIGGLLNGAPFDALRDADDLFGSVLEVMAKGKYFWVPLETVEALALNPPRFPRDLIWAPARLAMNEGASGEVFLPTRYPGAEGAADELLRLARATDWTEPTPGLVLGQGLRMFLAGEDAQSLLDWRQLEVGGLVDEDAKTGNAAQEEE